MFPLPEPNRHIIPLDIIAWSSLTLTRSRIPVLVCANHHAKTAAILRSVSLIATMQ